MFHNKKLVDLISELFGYPRRYDHGIVETEFNCPKCDNNRNKFNLVVNTDNLVFHCWACGYRGKTKKLFYDYGTTEQQSRYSSIIFGLEITPSTGKIIEESLSLGSFRSLKVEWKDSLNYKAAMKYLMDRKIDDKLIDKWDICYAENGKYADRIIVPSRALDGRVEYFIARSFFNDKFKYKNPKSRKSTVIFGDKFIDWKKPVILTEGVFDAMVLYNAVPILGTSIKGNTKLLKTIMKNKTPIIIGFDDDKVGIDARNRTAKYLKNLGVDIYIIKDNCYNDLAEAYQKAGKKYIIQLIRSAKQYDELEMALDTI